MARTQLFLVPFVAFVLLAVTGCATDKQIRAQAVDAHQELNPAVVNDPQVSGYLQQVGMRIVAAARKLDAQGVGPKRHFDKSEGDNAWMFSDQMQFHLVNSQTLNAFTTGGVHMYIYNALFQGCKTEDELAAVMAHEYAHVYCRHVQHGTNVQMVTQGTATALGVVGSAAGGTSGSLVSQLGPAALQLAGMGFTRHDEDEADEYGFKFYTVAGWDPNHFADFFKAMIAAGYDKTPEYASDHPMLAVRVKNTDRRISQLPKSWAKYRTAPIADPAKFAQLKAVANAACARQPTSESLAKAKTLLASFSSCVSPAEVQPEQVIVRRELAAHEAAKTSSNTSSK